MNPEQSTPIKYIIQKCGNLWGVFSPDGYYWTVASHRRALEIVASRWEGPEWPRGWKENREA